MPKRQKYIFCDCWLCVERDPENEGVSHPSDAIFAHRSLAAKMLEQRSNRAYQNLGHHGNVVSSEPTPSNRCG